MTTSKCSPPCITNLHVLLQHYSRTVIPKAKILIAYSKNTQSIPVLFPETLVALNPQVYQLIYGVIVMGNGREISDNLVQRAPIEQSGPAMAPHQFQVGADMVPASQGSSLAGIIPTDFHVAGPGGTASEGEGWTHNGDGTHTIMMGTEGMIWNSDMTDPIAIIQNGITTHF
jgi:hypothetical protein